MNVLRSKWTNSEKKIVAFMMVPAWVKEERADLVEKMNSGSSVELDNRIITHNLNNFGEDAVYNKMRYLGINNDANENVYVIF